MSLYLTINQVVQLHLKNQTKKESKMTLVIKNSKGGALLVSKMKFNRLEWDEKFRFPTSPQENVEFVLIAGDQKNAQVEQNILGKGKLFTKKFIKMFQNDIFYKQKNGQRFQYQVTLFDKFQQSQRQVGVVKLEIQYDPHKTYQGGLLTQPNLDLRGQLKTNPKYVKFYMGKCEKINFFSLVDQKAKTAKFRFVQSIYRDLE